MFKLDSGNSVQKWMLQDTLLFSLIFLYHPHSHQTMYSVILCKGEIQPQEKLEIHQKK